MDRKIVKNTTGKMAIWWLLNTLYGLIPLWCVLGLSEVPLNSYSKSIFNKEYNHLLHDGAINFFCLAIMGSVGVDILLSKSRLDARFVTWMIVLALVPFVVILLMYGVMLIGADGIQSFGTIVGFRIGLSVYTFLYCSVGKYIMFVNEKI